MLNPAMEEKEALTGKAPSEEKPPLQCSWSYFDGSITLDDWMGGDLAITNAARVSFGGESQELTGRDKKLIKYLADHKHMSPFRHCVLKLVFKDIPEVIARQLYKHCVGIALTSGETRFIDTPWNEISGRYVELPTEFFTPPVFRQQSKDNKQASDPNVLVQNQGAALGWYTQALDQAAASYQALLDLGVCKEQARMVLPMCFKTSFIWTGSLEAAVHLVKLRKHNGAQQEMIPVAEIVEKACRIVAPVATAALLGEETLCTPAQV